MLSGIANLERERRVSNFFIGFLFLFITVIFAIQSNTALAQDAGETNSTPKDLSQLPAWVELGSYQEGEVMYVLVKTKGGQSFDDATTTIMPACQVVISRTLKNWLGELSTNSVVFDEEFIRENLIVNERIIVRMENDSRLKHGGNEQLTQNLPNYRGFAQLKFTDKFRLESEHRCLQILTKSRLVYTGFIGGSILGLLALFFSYLQLDRATRGFYTSRLQSFLVWAGLLLLLLVIWCAKNCQF